ncbi:spore coat CotO family protein [Rossellomorea marisflavi]|uniref:spore coat CotO family protein n=1 Tax=Rossellomorea marisflavi TaxID=189381 RepID=UPI00279F5C71|nr:spore coat CotO family protein [Rossellomorea marisflavi]UTE71358.1 spore coat CotO family protein [Rossellomorea marisflavi]
MRKEKKPLLYIQQPRMIDVGSNMQNTYKGLAKKAESRPKPPEEVKKEVVEAVIEEPAVLTTESYFRPLKPFREMDLEGKIGYLEASIMGRAPFPCTFQTEHVSYRGVLRSSDSTTLTVKTFQGEDVVLEKRAVKNIQIIGLK